MNIKTFVYFFRNLFLFLLQVKFDNSWKNIFFYSRGNQQKEKIAGFFQRGVRTHILISG